MRKIEKAFVTLCIAIIPFFLLFAVVFFQTEDGLGTAVMAVAFSVFLISVRSLLIRHFKPRIETNPVLYEEQYWESKFEAQEARLSKLEAAVGLLLERQKKQDKREQVVNERANEGGQSLPVTKRTETLEIEHKRPLGQETTRWVVSLDIEALGRKKELTQNDIFSMYRTSQGKYLLIDFEKLRPNNFAEGRSFTKEMYDVFKSQEMEKIFALNSRNVINHKIIKLKAAEIQILNKNESDYSLSGVLIRKGEIEVDAPIQ